MGEVWWHRRSRWLHFPIQYHIRSQLMGLHNKVTTIGPFSFSEFIGVLRHMQRYFSRICDGTNVQAHWRSCTYGRDPNAIYISQGSLTCPSYIDMGPLFLYGDSDTPPHLVASYETLGIRRTYSRLKPPASSRGTIGQSAFWTSLWYSGIPTRNPKSFGVLICSHFYVFPLHFLSKYKLGS